MHYGYSRLGARLFVAKIEEVRFVSTGVPRPLKQIPPPKDPPKTLGPYRRPKTLGIGLWSGPRGVSFLVSEAPLYRPCSDKRFWAIHTLDYEGLVLPTFEGVA